MVVSKRTKRGGRDISFQWLTLAGGALLVFPSCYALIRTLLVIVTVENQSMSPVLRDADRVLVVRHWPAKLLRKGQIVIIWPWDGFGDAAGPFGVDPFIKRLIGLPGDTLVTSLEELDEVHRPRQAAAHDHQGKRTWHIPPEHCFVRSEQPTGGWDSLSWGPVPFRSVLGVVVAKLPRADAFAHIPTSRAAAPLRHAGPPLGALAPAFSAERLQGGTATIDDYVGQAVAFLFVLPYMGHEVVPGFEALRPAAARAGVDLVLVSVDEMAVTRAFAAEFGLSLPLLVAPALTNPFMGDYNIPFAPAYCLIDSAGRVQSAGYPGPTGETWKALVEMWTLADAVDKPD